MMVGSLSPRTSGTCDTRGLGSGLSNMYPLTEKQRANVYVREDRGFDFERGHGYIRPNSTTEHQVSPPEPFGVFHLWLTRYCT